MLPAEWWANNIKRAGKVIRAIALARIDRPRRALLTDAVAAVGVA